MPKIDHMFLIDQFRLARTVGRHLKSRTEFTPEEFISAAESAAKDHPTEWIVFYTLGDYCGRLERFTDALRACRRCVELRPKDIRSVYALATTYNGLTRAAWGPDQTLIAQRLAASTGFVVDPELARSELGKIGISVEQAAREARFLFRCTLAMHPDAESRTHLEENLRTLRVWFPQLETE